MDPMDVFFVVRFFIKLFSKKGGSGQKKKQLMGSADTLFDMTMQQLAEWPETRHDLEAAATQYPSLARLRARADTAYRILKGQDLDGPTV